MDYVDVSFPKLGTNGCFLFSRCLLFAHSQFERTVKSHSLLLSSHWAMALRGMCDYLWVSDRPCHRLGSELQGRGLRSGLISLQSYASLCKQNLDIRRANYKIRPKWQLDEIEIKLPTQ